MWPYRHEHQVVNERRWRNHGRKRSAAGRRDGRTRLINKCTATECTRVYISVEHEDFFNDAPRPARSARLYNGLFLLSRFFQISFFMLPVRFRHPRRCFCLLTSRQEKVAEDGDYATLCCCLARHVNIRHAGFIYFILWNVTPRVERPSLLLPRLIVN